MNTFCHLLLCLLLISTSSTRATTTTTVSADIAVLIMVDRDNYKNVLDADPWPTYYENFFDMVQNRIGMLDAGIRLTLLNVTLLTEEENSKVFPKEKQVWDTTNLMWSLRRVLTENYETMWNEANIVILITQKPLQLPGPKKERTFGDAQIENICGSFKIGVVEHHGLYIEVNTFVKVTLISLGVFLDGKGKSVGCQARDTYIMGNIPKTYPANFQFSSCTKTSASQQISVVNSLHGNCITPRTITGHKRAVTPYYNFNVNLNRDQFCGFNSNKETCLWTKWNACYVTCCNTHVFFHQLRGHSLPLPDGTPCGTEQVCLNGSCKRKTDIVQRTWEVAN